MRTQPLNLGRTIEMEVLGRSGVARDVLRVRAAPAAKTAQVAASRRVIAVELVNLLRIRRTLARLRMQIALGAAGDEVLVIGSRRMSRRMLMAYAQVAFAASSRNVCLARRALARLTDRTAAGR